MSDFSRRHIMAGIAGGFAGLAVPGSWRGLRAEPEIKRSADLKPGQFTWHPERSPEGPVAIVVSIPEQRVHVYRNGIRIGLSTCSTGAPGHSTPTGVFTILEKDKNHHSSTYNNAPMPNMNRLTWSGIALHAGNLPGYPASHGCIRLPMAFSERLFSVTHVGTPVILAGGHADPREVVHPGLVLADAAEAEVKSVATKVSGERLPWQAEVVPAGDAATSIIVSHGDMSITVLENGAVVASGPATISDPATPLGRHVFMLTGSHAGGGALTWHAISHHDTTGIPAGQPPEAVLARIRSDQTVQAAIRARMRPGLLLITTELPAHPDTRSGEDFVLMNTETG